MSALPIPAVWIPIVITGSNNTFSYDTYAAAVTASYTGTISAGIYTTPETWFAAVKTALEAKVTAVTITHDKSTGKASWQTTNEWIRFPPTGSTSLYKYFGFSPTGSNTFQTTFTSPFNTHNYWTPGIPIAIDSYTYSSSIENTTITLDGHHQRIVHGSTTKRDLDFKFIPIYKAKQDQENGNVYESFERIWADTKNRMIYWPDRTTDVLTQSLFVVKPTEEWNPQRQFVATSLYSFKIETSQWKA